jgi:uncharacterized alkaline shock family protein YloU
MTRPSGKTTLSPEVLITVARMAALSVPGVSRMAQVSGGFNRIFKRGIADGVRLSVEDGAVYVELYLILQNNVNVREVSRNIQAQVARTISDMVGLDIGHVNIHIEDIDYEEEPAAV